MQRAIRLLLLIEGIGYVVAGTIHAGAPGAGAAHRQASIAESVIAVVLLVGFALTWIAPAQTRRIGIGAQGFALLLTLVGAFTIAIGVGPRTVPDVLFHIGVLVALIAGLLVAARASTDGAGQHA